MAALSLANKVSTFTKQAKSAWWVEFNAAQMTLADKLAPAIHVQPSSFGTETYINFSDTPPLEEYDDGVVPVGQITSQSFTLKNRKFGRGLEISRDDFADMGNNPALQAQWLRKVANLGRMAKNKKVAMLLDLIRGTGTYLSTDSSRNLTAFDGVAYFSTAGRAMGSNLIDSSTTWDPKTLTSEFDQVMEAFMSHKALGVESIEAGSSSTYLRSLTPDKFIILCPSRYARLLASVWANRLIGATHDTASAGVSEVSSVENQIPMLAKMGVEIIPVQDIPSSSTGSGYYVFDVSDGMGEKAIAYQDREAPGLEVLGAGSELFVLSESVFYKVRFRGTYGWGHPARCIRVEKAA